MFVNPWNEFQRMQSEMDRLESSLWGLRSQSYPYPSSSWFDGPKQIESQQQGQQLQQLQQQQQQPQQQQHLMKKSPEGGVGLPSSQLSPFFQQLWNPSIDVRETDDAFEVQAELPGLDKEDVNIDFSDRDCCLIISGEKKYKFKQKSLPLRHQEQKPSTAAYASKGTAAHSKTSAVSTQEPATAGSELQQLQQGEEEGRYCLKECCYGRFERRIPFPRDRVKCDQIKASFNNGVLRVCIPKIACDTPSKKKITIE